MAKYNQETVKRITDLIKADSYTIAQICAASDINVDTFYEWKKSKPEFSDALKKAKDSFNSDKLVECEKSLLKLIRGYDFEEIKTVNVDDGEGNLRIKEQIVTKKHVLPNLGAIIHFQTNHDPDNWKNRQSTELTGKNGKDLLPFTKMMQKVAERREKRT